MSDCADFEGMTLTEAVAVLGTSPQAVRMYLYHRGYRNRHGRYRLQETVYEIEDAIASRQVLPAEPCWRCGARQGCEHR